MPGYKTKTMNHHSKDEILHTEATRENSGHRRRRSSTSDFDPADKKYGWVHTVCMVLITANTWGVSGASIIYFAYYLANDTFDGQSKLTISALGGFSSGMMYLVAPLVSPVSTKLGTQATLAVGTVLESAALTAASFSRQLWHIYLTQGLLFGCGAGILLEAAAPTIPQGPIKHRRFANTIALVTVFTGSGGGAIGYSFVTRRILQHLGLAWAFRITACSTLVFNTICTLLLRDRYKTLKTDCSPREADLFPIPDLAWILVSTVLFVVGFTAVVQTTFKSSDVIAK